VGEGGQYNAYTDGDPIADSHAIANGHGYPNGNSITDNHAIANGHGHPNSNSIPDSHAIANGHGYPNGNSIPDSHAHAAASADFLDLYALPGRRQQPVHPSAKGRAAPGSATCQP
jgi:hypothetical protein